MQPIATKSAQLTTLCATIWAAIILLGYNGISLRAAPVPFYTDFTGTGGAAFTQVDRDNFSDGTLTELRTHIAPGGPTDTEFLHSATAPRDFTYSYNPSTGQYVANLASIAVASSTGPSNPGNAILVDFPGGWGDAKITGLTVSGFAPGDLANGDAVIVGNIKLNEGFTVSGTLHGYADHTGDYDMLGIDYGTISVPDEYLPDGPDDPGIPVVCHLATDGCKSWKCNAAGASSAPTQYATGEIIMGLADIADPADGWLSVRRSYDNRSATDYNGPNGWNWFVDRIPYIVQSTIGSNDHMIVEATPGNSIFFDLSGGTYAVRYPVVDLVQQLTHDTGAHTFTYREIRDGNVSTWIFNDCDSAQTTYSHGIFSSYIDSAGTVTAVTSYMNNKVAELERLTVNGSVATVYSLSYEYYTDSEAIHKIKSVTLRHTTTDGAGWIVDRKVGYTYYSSSDSPPASGPSGSVNDLETATTSDAAGNTIDTSYYRYHMYAPAQIVELAYDDEDDPGNVFVATNDNNGLSAGDSITISGATDTPLNGTFTITSAGSNYFFYHISVSAADDDETPSSNPALTLTTTRPPGFKHGLKYVFGPASFARLVNNVGDPTVSALTDTQVAPFADNYFEYDTERRVTKEIAQGAGCSCAGNNGHGTFTYSRTINANGGYSDDVDKWKYKTVEQFIDFSSTVQSTTTIYSNYRHQTMLKVYCDGDGSGSPPKWCWYYHYDSAGRIDWEAEPSAVSTYDDTHLNPIDSGSAFGHLNGTSGLIKLHVYGTSTTATSTAPGNVLGYLQAEQVKQGYSGTLITVEDCTYLKQTADGATTGDGLGATVYYLASDTRYNSVSGGSPAGAEKTTYACTYYTSSGLATTAIKTKATTRPIIVAAQNGPASSTTDTANADISDEVYDPFGHLLWSRDADGYIVYTQCDPATGSIIKEIRDVNTSTTGDFTALPSGWSTPSDGGQHLTTTMDIDGLGRAVKVTDPDGNITYTVYIDPNHETRLYPGWQSSTSTTTGPVQLMREHRPATVSSDRPYRESLTYAVSTGSPAHVTSGSPDGTESITISNLQTLSREYLDNSSRVVQSDRYFTFSGMSTYYEDGASTHVGTVNSNFYSTTYGFDERGRLNKTTNPLGTITRTVYDGLDRVIAVWIGTDDTSWTASGGGGDLTKVTMNQYDSYADDHSSGVGDGLLTRTTQYPDSTLTHARVTLNYYDWRDRLVATKSGALLDSSGDLAPSSETDGVHRPITYCALDNLGRCLSRFMYDGDAQTITTTSGLPDNPTSSLLRAQIDSSYDDQDRIYRTFSYDINQADGSDGITSGTPSNGLATNTWYNHRGSVIKSAPPGGRVSKMTYDGAGRILKQYVTDGGGDSAWTDAGNVSDDAVLQEMLSTYDHSGNLVLTTTKERFHDETTAGELIDSSTSPKARVTFAGTYYDAANRRIASVQLGTVSGDTYTVPGTIPTSSDTILVTNVAYNNAGWVKTITDPKGLITATVYDALRRVTQKVEAYDGSTTLPLTASAITNSTNRATNFSYDGLGRIYQMVAVMPTGILTMLRSRAGTVPAVRG